jgi:hypothetical protein
LDLERKFCRALRWPCLSLESSKHCTEVY